MRGTANKTGIAYKRDVIGVLGGEVVPVVVLVAPAASSSKGALLQWLSDNGFSIPQSASLTKSELWDFINDVIDNP